MSAPPFRLGLVGCGRLAEAAYVPALRATPGVRLVAVADPDADRRAAVASLAAAAGCGPASGGPVRAFPDAATLLGEAGAGLEVDGIVLASPAATHAADAERAAITGVPALVEKPPALDGAGAAALAALDPPPWIGFNRRFDPGAGRVRATVPAHGDLDLRLEIGYRRAGWGAHAVCDDALLDLGPHLIDWARWISGAEVVEVACTALGPERAILDLTLGRGRARLRAATDRPHTELVELRDGAGRLLARHRLGGLAVAVRGRLWRPGPSALVASLAGQLAAFAAAASAAPAGRSAAGGQATTTDPATSPATTTDPPAAPAGGSPGGQATTTDPATSPATPAAPAATSPTTTTDPAPGRPTPTLGTAADGLAVMLVVDAARASAAGHGRRVTVTSAGVR